MKRSEAEACWAAPVAALFVETDGCYFGVLGVDPWDIKRDARNYSGPHPVVAHPPCQLWGRFAAINFKRWGGEHNRPGNDGGCFLSGLSSVIKFGGVLEHPKASNAFLAYQIQKPSGIGWKEITPKDKPFFNGGKIVFTPRVWVCEVWQSAYGHKTAKATWLLYSGRNRPFDLDWSRPDGTHQIGFHDQRGKARNKPTISGKAASATPVAFRDVLIRLARQARPNAEAHGRAVARTVQPLVVHSSSEGGRE